MGEDAPKLASLAPHPPPPLCSGKPDSRAVAADPGPIHRRLDPSPVLALDTCSLPNNHHIGARLVAVNLN